MGKYLACGVMFAKFVDSVADGFSFFATNLVYIVLLSSLISAKGVKEHPDYVVPLTVVLAIACVGHLWLAEIVPQVYYMRRQKSKTPDGDDKASGYQPEEKKTVELVSAWWCSNYAWLLGFSVWTTLLVLLRAFFRIGLSAYWIVVAIVFVGFVLFAVLKAIFQARRKVAQPLIEEAPVVATTSIRQLFPVLKERTIELMLRGCNWVFGVAIYFSLLQTGGSVAVFVQALSATPTSNSWLWSYAIVVSSIAMAVGTLVEFLALSVKDLDPSEPWTGVVLGKLPTVVSRHAALILIKDLHKMLMLSLAYIVAKAYQAMQQSYTAYRVLDVSMDPREPTKFYLALVPIAQAVAIFLALMHTAYALKTQEKHAENHGDMCVCVACAPVYYDENGNVRGSIKDDKECGTVHHHHAGEEGHASHHHGDVEHGAADDDRE